VSIKDEQHLMLEKLRVIKGYNSSEIVQVALDEFLTLPPSQIEEKIMNKRKR
jgi:hypothetical protein